MRILVLFILLCLRLAAAAPLAAQEGRLLERTPFEWPTAFVDEMRTSMPEVDSLLAAVKVYRITYLSDGLKVKGFLAEPTKPGRYPSIIYNRGGNREFGKINAGQLLFHVV